MFWHAGNTPGSAPFNVTAADDSPASTTSDSMPRPYTSTKTFRWTPSPRRAHASRGRFEPTELDRRAEPGPRRPEVWDRFVVTQSRSQHPTLPRWGPSILPTPSTTLGGDRRRSSWRTPTSGIPSIPTETRNPLNTTVRSRPASSARPTQPPSPPTRAVPAGALASRRPYLHILAPTACTRPGQGRQAADSASRRVGTRFSRLTAPISAAPSSTRPRSTFPPVAPTLQTMAACCRPRR